jgi:hypothetical protein
MEVLLVRNCPIPGRPSDPAPFHRHGRGERLALPADVATAADCGAGGLSGEVPEVHRSLAMGLPWLWIFQSKYRINIEKMVFFITEATRVMKNDGWIKKYVIFHQFGWLTFQTWRLHKVKLPGWTLGWVGEILGSEAIEWPENGGFLTTKSKQVPKGNSWDWPRIGFLPSKQGKAWCRVYFIHLIFDYSFHKWRYRWLESAMTIYLLSDWLL